MGPDAGPIETVSFERVELVSRKVVSDALSDKVKFDEMRLADIRATELSTFLRGFGKTARFEFACPATWWQHIKHALRSRFPRLFGRLKVKQRREVIDTGVVLAGIPEWVGARQAVIPYLTGKWVQ
jgi:hypothetical protein